MLLIVYTPSGLSVRHVSPQRGDDLPLRNNVVAALMLLTVTCIGVGVLYPRFLPIIPYMYS